ncbi:MAG TPA: iron-containing redox enzyme family protein [Acidimicrobiales bacterium]|nr:iron-containing redox enzyme family protein [Acidimicrobiales bacterium]
MDTAARILQMLEVHDLHLAPIDSLGERAKMQHHPDTAAKKYELDDWFVSYLDALDAPEIERGDAVASMRALGRVDLVPPVYEWLAEEATLEQLREYLAVEGGPDGGFDDLVAACQIGIDGPAKLELAQNYWDEMGNGRLDRVHTELHRKLSRSLDLRAVPRTELPLEALERAALGSVLATNRWLQPEMIGALGLIELQAGPRCRKVVRALERLGCGWDALDFYAEHAEADPRHGKDWVDKVVGSLQDTGDWGPRIVRGACWRSAVNRRFFTAMHDRFVTIDLREDDVHGDARASQADAGHRGRAAA